MIEVRHLYKSFDGKEVLHDINATFLDGRVNLIIGQSGSGKTVLIKNIVGLLQPTRGEISYDGRDFLALSTRECAHLRREMGMIFQSAALFDSLTVLQNVTFPLDMFSSLSAAARRERAQQCLRRVNLDESVDDKFPEELSGGMQKRVAIARAIVQQPRYLFCDEPNSGLDPKTSLVIDQLIASITHEDRITTIVNTHDMNSVMGIGEHITFIHQGRAHWQGSNHEILEATNPTLQDFIFASDILRQAKIAYDQAKQR